MYLLELAGEDDTFAAAEAQTAATAVEVVAPGLAIAGSVQPDRIRGLAFTRRASDLVGRTDARIEGARALLETAPLDRRGSVAVRARDVRRTAEIDTRRAERELGRVLVDRGFDVDLDSPDHELRAVFASDTCALGWLIVEAARDFGVRAPSEKPFFQPGSMDPIEARAIVNLAGARPGATVLDPMCGTGGVLVEAGLVGARVFGFDVQAKMALGARLNLSHYLGSHFEIGRADAARLPVVDDAVDVVVFDVPYGRQSKVESDDPVSLVSDALLEALRVSERAVVVADRSLEREATEANWTVGAVFPRRVHRSLTRHVHVLTAPG